MSENGEITTNCICRETKPLAINCDTTFLSNKNFVYWSTSCDSSKLIFQTSSGNKFIIESFGPENIEFSGRIGKSFIKEFESGLLFQNRWISGCCMAPDYFIINKKTGFRIESFPSSHNLYFDSDFDFLITFSDSTLQELTMYDLEHGTAKTIKYFSQKQAAQISESSQQIADLFSQVKRVSDNYILPFRYTNGSSTEIKDSIVFTK